MEILATEDVASVTLFTIKISESEMQAYESCISHVLDRLSSDEIEALTGHTRDELTDVHHELLLSDSCPFSKAVSPREI